ncbi:hypothetical protein EON65_02590 [archaeon]|nr:MAG: hypothetical protein EON65_02590 [archaeon]
MEVSHDFLLRIIGTSDGILLPTQKHLVTDYNVEVILKRIGSVQVFLDISRCPHLSAHIVSGFVPSHCTVLLYLDISYTNCSDLDIVFTKCRQLKTLNIAGLELIDSHLEGIEYLVDLQVLSIRSSNIQDIAAVGQLEMLRSLDLGCTRLCNVHVALAMQHRLEELLLDGCTLLDNIDITKRVPHLPELKLLNVVNSDFSAYRDLMPLKIHHRVYIETNTRRIQFFDAILRNDSKEMCNLLTYGQDMNMQATMQDAHFLTSAFIDRCTYPKYRLQTPFFLLTPTTPAHHMPAAIHIAIWFNSLECLQILIDLGAAKDFQVLLGEVRVVEGGILEEAPPPTDASVTFMQPQLCNAEHITNLAYDRKAHRLTEKMFDKNVKHWKHECQKIHKRLLSTLQYGSQMTRRLKQEEEDEKHKKKSRNKAQKSRILPTTVEVLEDVDDDEQSVLSMQSRDRRNSVDSLDGSVDNLAQLAGGGNIDQDSGSVVSTSDVTDLSSIGSYTYINPDIFLEEAKQRIVQRNIERPKILPKKEKMCGWRDHGMVQAVCGPPRVYHINEEIPTEELVALEQKSKMIRDKTKTKLTRGKKSLLEDMGSTQRQFRVHDVSVMGERSYWMESRAKVIALNAEAAGTGKSGQHIKANLGVYEKFTAALQLGKNVYLTEREKEENWLANRRGGSMPERKQQFLQAVKERMEKKFSDNM